MPSSDIDLMTSVLLGDQDPEIVVLEPEIRAAHVSALASQS
jgi:hypothetical protein